MLNDRKKVRQITRFLTGECSPSEQQLIVGLIQSDKQYSDIYYSLRQIWENRIFQVSPDTYDTATAWSKVNKHIEKKQLIIVEKQFLRRITPVGWLKYAASVAALFLISFSVFQLVHENKSTLKSIASGNATSSNVALADGSHIILNNASGYI